MLLGAAINPKAASKTPTAKKLATAKKATGKKIVSTVTKKTDGKGVPSTIPSIKKRKVCPPRSAAVVVTSTTEGPSKAEIMAEARRRVRLEELGITHVRPKTCGNRGDYPRDTR